MNDWLKRTLFVLFLLSAFGVIAFLTMPVQFVALQLGLPDGIRVGNLSGTVWSGSATELAYQGKVALLPDKVLTMDVDWQWCPGLSLGPTAMCVRARSPSLSSEGTVAYSLFGGTVEARDARINAQIDGPLNLGPLKTRLKGAGEVHLELLSLDPKDTRLLIGLRATGSLKGLQAHKFDLGDYQWRAGLSEDVGLTSDFGGGGDRFMIKGRASLDPADRSYRYTVDMKTEDLGLIELLKTKAKKSKGDTLTFSGDGKFGS